MSSQRAGNSDPVFTQEDLINPLRWLENLSEGQLLNWLRKALWSGNALPFIIPPTSRIGFELSSLFRNCSPDVKIRVRAVMPILLQEWGRTDPGRTLDDMLVICGRVRCAAAEPAIALLMSERLKQQPDAVELRQNCLRVLSGFGCTERTVSKFEHYITDIEYAAICYRALYRYDSRYAAIELENIVSMFEGADADDELDFVIANLAQDLHLQSSRQFIELLTRYLEQAARPELIIDVLEVLRRGGLLTSVPFIEARAEERAKAFRLLLQRCPPEDFQLFLSKLDSIGLGLYSVELANGQEYIQGVAYDSETDRKVKDYVMPTKDLSGPAVDAFVIGSELIATGWADAPSANDWLH